MSKSENVLTEIRNNVSSFVGREVMVKANRGQKKPGERRNTGKNSSEHLCNQD